MQTILGANGIIGEELAKELRRQYTDQITLVGRNPQKVHKDDMLRAADLLNQEGAKAALEGTEIAYLTIGLPYTSEVWLRDWPIVLENVIAGCRENGCKLVYFDNTYMYPQDSPVQTEKTPFGPGGKKGQGKAKAARLLLAAIEKGEIEAVICRAPEFYGPGKTKSITNQIIFENIRNGKKPVVFVRDDTQRTLIYTPDAAKATALIGNSPDTYGQTWHLPCDDDRMTYREMIAEIGSQLKREIPYRVLPAFILRLMALFHHNIRETIELLPRYGIDNIFDSTKFKLRFPGFEVTKYADGISRVLKDLQLK